MRDPQPHASSSTAPVPGLSSKAFPPPPPIDAQWKQVQQFPEEDGDEWEEEVSLSFAIFNATPIVSL